MSEQPQPTTPGLTERQAEIVAAATELFGERGYAGCSMREIASRIGVTEPALYRHFPGKRELFATVVRVAGRRIAAEAASLIDGVTADNARERFEAAIEDRRRAATHYAPVLRVILNAAISEPAVLAEFRSAVVEPIAACITAKAVEIDAALAVSEAEATRPARVRALLALFVGTMVSSFALGDRPDAAVADAALRIMRWNPTVQPPALR